MRGMSQSTEYDCTGWYHTGGYRACNVDECSSSYGSGDLDIRTGADRARCIDNGTGSVDGCRHGDDKQFDRYE